MKARRGQCAYCHRFITVTAAGLWPHGPARSCRGNHTLPAIYGLDDTQPTRHWPSWLYGRRVTTIPGPGTWNPKETAA